MKKNTTSAALESISSVIEEITSTAQEISDSIGVQADMAFNINDQANALNV